MSFITIILAFALCVCAVHGEYTHGENGHDDGGHGYYKQGAHDGSGHDGYGHGYHYGPFSYGYKGPHSHVDVSVKGPHAEYTSYGFKAGGYGGHKHY